MPKHAIPPFYYLTTNLHLHLLRRFLFLSNPSPLIVIIILSFMLLPPIAFLICTLIILQIYTISPYMLRDVYAILTSIFSLMIATIFGPPSINHSQSSFSKIFKFERYPNQFNFLFFIIRLEIFEVCAGISQIVRCYVRLFSLHFQCYVSLSISHFPSPSLKYHAISLVPSSSPLSAVITACNVLIFISVSFSLPSYSLAFFACCREFYVFVWISYISYHRSV